jgi:hypothetical protein
VTQPANFDGTHRLLDDGRTVFDQGRCRSAGNAVAITAGGSLQEVLAPHGNNNLATTISYASSFGSDLGDGGQ